MRTLQQTLRTVGPALVVCLMGVTGTAVEAAGATSDIAALVDAGRTDDARDLIARTLESEAGDDDLARALRWLGRIEVADQNWTAAMAAYERLATEFAATAAARDAATEMTLLQALGDRNTFGKAAERSPPSATATPATEPEVTAPDGILVGAFGVPFNSAEDAGLQIRDYLNSKGIATEFEVTANEALRGNEAVRAYLLARTRELGKSNLILVRSRWGFREFIEIGCYSDRSELLWREKVKGGLGDRGDTVSPKIMERVWPKLDRRIGGPCLQ